MTDFLTLKKLYDDNKIHLIDVREEDEWQKGHVKGAKLIPMSTLVHIQKLHDIPKDLPIYLYCSSGKRAKIAQDLLSPFIDHIEAVEGGFDDFKAHSFPTECSC